jgi:hypothetical protein
MEWWDSEIIFGLSLTEILNIVLGIIIVAGIIYSIFFQKKEQEVI